MPGTIATSEIILVVGDGISATTAALDAAECGEEVVGPRNTKLSTGVKTTTCYRWRLPLQHPRAPARRRLKQVSPARLTWLIDETLRAASRKARGEACRKSFQPGSVLPVGRRHGARRWVKIRDRSGRADKPIEAGRTCIRWQAGCPWPRKRGHRRRADLGRRRLVSPRPANDRGT